MGIKNSNDIRFIYFDLDDTLYPEHTYVESGFRAVANWGETSFGWPASESLQRMHTFHAAHGRGRVFDLWFKAQNVKPSKRLISEAVRTYRHHDPEIYLPKPHRALLEALAAKGPLYLVTDGHKIVQAKKVDALNLGATFTGIYITHRYGLAAAKPSLRCFDLIRRRERSEWQEMVYVGDNPAKDFVALNQVGGKTVRVLTGRHAGDLAPAGFEAAHQIDHLTQLVTLLR
jgi:putative hydrolase of the HAD superfamily